MNRLLKIILSILLLFFICEYLIYFLVLLQCKWPSLSDKHLDPYIPLNDKKPLRIMILADPHLLGVKTGHWFDKLRREWQMKRSFQTTLFIHHPDVVFILGDLFDEGKWATKDEFILYLNGFHNLFSHDESVDLKVIAGNHDMGYHYDITKKKYLRFREEFGVSAVDLWTKHGVHFVLLNSMAFEGDQCFLCAEAKQNLDRISELLNCISGDRIENKVKCDSLVERYRLKDRLLGLNHGEYSRPIVLQHFPMWRESDANCAKLPDSAPRTEKFTQFRPHWEALSANATKEILMKLNPRLILSGHTHHSCRTDHKISLDTNSQKTSTIPEYNIASFSWRNINSPSFLLVKISINDYEISKCYLPQESTVKLMYCMGIPLILLWFTRQIIWNFIRSVFTKSQKRH